MHEKSKGTNELFCADIAVTGRVKSRKKKLAMTWIYHKKAYDRVEWIVEYLMFGAVGINTVLVDSIEKRRCVQEFGVR